MNRAAQAFVEAAFQVLPWQKALAELADYTGGFESHFTVWNRTRSRVEFSARAGRFPEEATERYLQHFCAIDPCREALSWSRTGEILLTQDFHDPDFIRRSEIYNDFLLPLGARYVMGVKLTDSASSMSMLRIQRSPAKGPFSHAEVRRLRALVPTLSHAAELYLRCAQIAQEAVLVRAALDHLSVGVIIVDLDSRVLHANAIAERIFSTSECLTFELGQFASHDANTDAALKRLVARLRNPTETLETGSVLRTKIREGGSGSYEVSATLIRMECSDALAAPAGAVLVSIFPSSLPFDRLVARIAKRFHLTPAEAAVAEGIARGATINRYAADRGISVNTVRTHLKAVFSKTGACSQSDLVRLVFGIDHTFWAGDHMTSGDGSSM